MSCSSNSAMYNVLSCWYRIINFLQSVVRSWSNVALWIFAMSHLKNIFTLWTDVLLCLLHILCTDRKWCILNNFGVTKISSQHLANIGSEKVIAKKIHLKSQMYPMIWKIFVFSNFKFSSKLQIMNNSIQHTHFNFVFNVGV